MYGMNTMPDSYIIHAGTPAILKDRFVRDSIVEGKPLRSFTAKVEILDGEFKGKTLFIVWWNCFRFIGGEYPRTPQARMAPHKRSGRRQVQAAVPVADAKLVLTDLTTNPSASGNYLNVDGRVRCTSGEPIKFVQFTVSFEDTQGKLVRSQDGFCTPLNLNPGDVGSISIMAQSDTRYAKVKIDFKDMEKSLQWVDQSGTNAHQ
jgi:hypothetical protein